MTSTIVTYIIFAFSIATIKGDTMGAFHCGFITNATKYAAPNSRNCSSILNIEKHIFRLYNFSRYQPVGITACRHTLTEVITPLSGTEPAINITRTFPMSYDDCVYLSIHVPKMSGNSTTPDNTKVESVQQFNGTNFYIDSKKYGHQDVSVERAQYKHFTKSLVLFDLLNRTFISDATFDCENKGDSCVFDNTTFIWSRDDTHPKCNNITPSLEIIVTKRSNTETGKHIYTTMEPQERLSFSIPSTTTQICNQNFTVVNNHILASIEKINENSQATNMSISTNLTMISDNTKLIETNEIAQRVENLEDNIQFHECMRHNELMNVIKQRLRKETYLNTPTKGAYLTAQGTELRIIHCKHFLAKLDTTSKCFDAIPVIYGKETRFISPVTRIIQNHAVRIPCNQRRNFTFKVNGTTHCINHGKWEKVTSSLEEFDPASITNIKENNIKGYVNDVYIYKNSLSEAFNVMLNSFADALQALHFIITTSGSYAAFVFTIIFIVCMIKRRSWN